MPRRYLSRLARSRYDAIRDDFQVLLGGPAGAGDRTQAAASLLAILDIHPADKAELGVELGFTEPEPAPEPAGGTVYRHYFTDPTTGLNRYRDYTDPDEAARATHAQGGYAVSTSREEAPEEAPAGPDPIHDIRAPFSGALLGVVIEREGHFRAYDQTEAYIDTFDTFEAAKRAVEDAYIPPPPTPRGRT